MKYDAVIFDLFGTLVPGMPPETYEGSLRETAIAAGVDPDEFILCWLDDKMAVRRMTGYYSTQTDFIADVCRRLGHTPDDGAVGRAADVRAEFVRKWLTPRADAVGVLKRLKEKGLKLGLMSVCSADTPPLWPQTPLAPLFDAALLSCEVGLTKPDPRFYALACERLSVLPGRCLYVGDGAGDELTGALNAGMRAILICAPGEEEIVMARDDARNWQGSRIASLSEVPALVE